MKDEKIKALANLLVVETDEITENDWEDNAFDCNGETYLVLTDKEADEKAQEEIENSLWAFNTDFIIRHTSTYEDMDTYEFQSAVKSLQKAQENECENLNPLVKALIEDIGDFVDDAIMADGRGHFIARYDGDESEEMIDGTWYYIYRVD